MLAGVAIECYGLYAADGDVFGHSMAWKERRKCNVGGRRMSLCSLPVVADSTWLQSKKKLFRIIKFTMLDQKHHLF